MYVGGRRDSKSFKASLSARTRPTFHFLQPDQLYMAMLFWYLVKSDFYATVHAYTGQVTFYKIPETYGHVN